MITETLLRNLSTVAIGYSVSVHCSWFTVTDSFRSQSLNLKPKMSKSITKKKPIYARKSELITDVQLLGDVDPAGIVWPGPSAIYQVSI